MELLTAHDSTNLPNKTTLMTRTAGSLAEAFIIGDAFCLEDLDWLKKRVMENATNPDPDALMLDVGMRSFRVTFCLWAVLCSAPRPIMKKSARQESDQMVDKCEANAQSIRLKAPNCPDLLPRLNERRALDVASKLDTVPKAKGCPQQNSATSPVEETTKTALNLLGRVKTALSKAPGCNVGVTEAGAINKRLLSVIVADTRMQTEACQANVIDQQLLTSQITNPSMKTQVSKADAVDQNAISKITNPRTTTEASKANAVDQRLLSKIHAGPRMQNTASKANAVNQTLLSKIFLVQACRMEQAWPMLLSARDCSARHPRTPT
jgi:hypothetical protein